MKNFKILLIQELHVQLKTFTFAVMILTALVVGLLVTSVQLSSFKDRWSVYKEQSQQSQERLGNTYFYSELKVDVYMPPTILSVFAKGLDETIGNKITVSALDLPELVATSQRGNAFIKLFSNIDISGVVKILSIFIILMSTCPIALDREQQTGKLIFCGSVGRLEYYLSKYVSLLIIAGLCALVVFFIPVVWMWFDPHIALSLSDTGSILYILLSSILYFSVFILIGLSVSAMSSKTSIATLSGLMIWVILAYVYPFTVNSIIDRTVKIPSDYLISEQIKRINNDVMLENIKYGIDNNLFVQNSLGSMSMVTPNIVAKNTVSTKTAYDNTLKMHDFTLLNWFNRINTITGMKEEQNKYLVRKKTLYDRFAFFLPDRIYENLCVEAAGTDYHFREKQFTDAAKNYRSMLMDYTKSKNGFGYAFFTQMPESEMLPDNSGYNKELDDRYSKPENLNKIATDFPNFNMPLRSNSFLAWMGLLLANILVGGLSLWTYNKYLSFK